MPDALTPARQVEIVEQVLAILDHGSFTATYKHAVLLALVDLCKETCSEGGAPPQVLTTRKLAEKVLELYWPQTLRWRGEAVLHQNAPGRGAIIAAVENLREYVYTHNFGAPTYAQLRPLVEDRFQDAVDKIEEVLTRYPLPKLQRIAGVCHNWIYRISWEDSGSRPRGLRALQRGEASSFDNRIHLQPGVAQCFVAMSALLRPLIMQHWASKVANLNALDVGHLHEFLFGCARMSLDPVRQDLRTLQDGRCFYCQNDLRGSYHVDHFIPWSRHPENGLHNLVASHPDCNSSKLNFLASHTHVQRWCARVRDRHDTLVEIAERRRWPTDADRVLSIARVVYHHAPDGLMLWQAKNDPLVKFAEQRVDIENSLRAVRIPS